MSKKVLAIVCIVGFIIATYVIGPSAVRSEGASDAAEKISIEVWFSPKGGCLDAIVAEIRKSEKTILVQAYSFTSKPIADELVAAHARGVDVKVIIDDKAISDQHCVVNILNKGGISIMVDAKHAIAHNKIIMIDSKIVITGSYNFSGAAERSNAENLLVIRNQSLAAKYEENWHTHEGHSYVYE